VLEELRAKEQGGSVLPETGQVGGLSLLTTVAASSSGATASTTL